MKLRIQGDALRLRLSQTEVLALVQTGRVEEPVHFGPGRRLCYGVHADETEGLVAVWGDDALSIGIPHDWLVGWSEDDRSGFEGTQDVGGGRTLALAVEKEPDADAGADALAPPEPDAAAA